MSKTKPSFGVILHMPEDPEDLKAIQKIFDQTFCKCVAKKLNNSNLTDDEKRYVIKKIADSFG